MSLPVLDTVAIVGVGLIGGSLGGALKARGLARRVLGVGRSQQRLAAACDARLVDDATCDLVAAAREASVMIFCTPVDQIAGQVRQASASTRPGALLTDAGSVKGTICTALRDLAQGPSVFVGSHPLAGSEKAGFEHADAGLFEGRTCVVTPLPDHQPNDVERTEQFWQAVGMQVLRMSPVDHDAALAYTSHVPHLLAAALAAALPEEQRPLTASGFRDTTRIAAGDPDLWVAILLQNATAVLAALADVDAKLASFRAALTSGNAPALKMLLQTAKRNRDALG